jgi:two-component system, OmpR family, sensor histidine kinase VicK
MKAIFKKLQSLHIKLVVIYVLLIIIGMQIIGLYFTNNLEKELTKNFKTNINQQIKSINYDIRTVYNENKSSPNKIQKEVQKVVDEYALRTEIDTIRFINDSEVILATSNDTTKENINQKINDKQIQNSLSLGKTNDRIKLRDDPSGKVRVWVKNFPIKDDNKILGVIHIEESIEPVYAQLMKINSIFIIGTGLSLTIRTRPRLSVAITPSDMCVITESSLRFSLSVFACASCTRLDKLLKVNASSPISSLPYTLTRFV